MEKQVRLGVPLPVFDSDQESSNEIEINDKTQDSDNENQSDIESDVNSDVISEISDDLMDDEFYDNVDNIQPLLKRQKTVKEDVDHEATRINTDKWINQDNSARLPIKDVDGNLHIVKAPLIVDRDDTQVAIYKHAKALKLSKKDPLRHPLPVVTKPVLKPKTVDPIDSSPECKTTVEKQERLAELGSLICEDPENNVYVFNLARIT